MATSPLIICENLGKTVSTPEGPLTILESIDLQIYPGESVAIMGPSGSGKSTLLSLLAGLDLPTQGSLSLLGHSLEKMNEENRALHRAGKVGFIFQSFELIDSLNALENVMLPLELRGDKQVKSKATQWLTEMGLEHRLHHFPTTLSGGEQQRVAIARAFITDPQLIFADEPTGNLDENTGARVIDMMMNYQKKGAALVLVTHDSALADRCDRQIHLHKGQITS